MYLRSDRLDKKQLVEGKGGGGSSMILLPFETVGV